MRMLLLMIMSLGLISCGETKPDPNVHYIDVDLEVVSGDVFKGEDKYHTPEKTLLVRLVKDTTKYTELKGVILKDEMRIGFKMTDSLYYMSRPGTKLHFDYIRKSRFWTMK